MFFFMIRRHTRSTRTDTLLPYTSLFRSVSYLLPAGRYYIGCFGDAGRDNRLVAARPWPGVLFPALLFDDSRREVMRSRGLPRRRCRSEEHTSELQSLMRISYAVFCLKKKKKKQTQ